MGLTPGAGAGAGAGAGRGSGTWAGPGAGAGAGDGAGAGAGGGGGGGGGGAVPAPLRTTFWVEAASVGLASSLKVSVAARAAADWGTKVTLSVQVPAGAMGVPTQVPPAWCTKSAVLVPPTATEVTWRGELPGLVSVTVLAALDEPIWVSAKATLVALRLATGAGVAPLRATVSGPVGSPGMLREAVWAAARRSEEHTSELQSLTNLVCRLLLE